MNRRSLLRTVGASGLLAGGYVGGVRVASSPSRSVSVSARALSDDRLGADGTVREPFSDDRPARVDLTLTNDGDAPLPVSFPADDSPISAPATPVSNLLATHDDDRGALLLFPEDRRHVSPVIDPVPNRRGVTNCWNARTTRWGQNDVVDGVRLDPGETNAGTYTVLDLSELHERVLPGDCLEPGRYRLTQRLRYGRGDRQTGTVEYVIEMS